MTTPRKDDGIDYRSLLKRYITHVWECEGQAYNHRRFADYSKRKVQFTEAEWDVLEKL